MTSEKRWWLFIPLAVFVALAGAAVGGFFGTAAGGGYVMTHNGQVYQQYYNRPNYNDQDGPAIYAMPHDTLPEGLRHECHSERWVPYGNMLGSIGGAATGGLWSLLVWRRRKSSGGRIVASGIGWGIVAGLVTTALLHAGLWAVVVVEPDGGVVVFGLILGLIAVIAGTVTGLVCGLLAWAVAAWMRRGAIPAAAPSEATPPRESSAGTPEAGA